MISSKKSKFSSWQCTSTLVRHFCSSLNSFSDTDNKTKQNCTHYREVPFCSVSPSCPLPSSAARPPPQTKELTKKAALYIKPSRIPCVAGGSALKRAKTGQRMMLWMLWCTTIDKELYQGCLQHTFLSLPDNNTGVGSYSLSLRMSKLIAGGINAFSPRAYRCYWAESGFILRLLLIGKTLPTELYTRQLELLWLWGHISQVLWMQLNTMTSFFDAALSSWVQGGFSWTSG